MTDDYGMRPSDCGLISSQRRSLAARRGRRGPTRASPPAAGAAFTLLEILLVLALIGLLSAVLISGANAIFRASSRPPPEDVFWRVVAAARQLAITNERTVQLRFDAKEKRLIWSDGATTASEPLVTEGDAALQFIQPRGGTAVLLGGQLVETAEVPLVNFYSDGTCDAFRVQLKLGAAPSFVLAIDPWTCAPVLQEEKK